MIRRVLAAVASRLIDRGWLHDMRRRELEAWRAVPHRDRPRRPAPHRSWVEDSVFPERRDG